MVFSSNIFLFAFLPLFLVAYYLTPPRGRSATILAFSYAFYAWWRPDFLGLLVGVTVVSYAFALAIHAASSETRRARLTAVAVGLNLAALAYFKYANFGVASLNAALVAAGAAPFAWAPVLLPVGLSFYIFHAISYVVDIRRRAAEPARNIVDFAAFIALFPHLVAGPVLRYTLLADQFRHRVHSLEHFSAGATRFMVGFCKKVLVADAVAPLANAVFGAPAPTLPEAWLGAIAYTVQLFFDFSGYTDMAIGLALMIGFRFPENFNDPYLSVSITEFWKRWHISLSSWLREYLYIPLGGNRKGVGRTYLNLWLTMVLGGLWHGANWTFVIWGAWHGGLLALERWLGARFRRPPPPPWAAVPKTMLLVVVGWVVFRAADLDGALRVLGGMAGLHGLGSSPEVAWQVTPDRLSALAVGGALVVLLPAASRALASMPARTSAAVANLSVALVPLFAWSVASLSAQSFTPFLYFQF
jgi:alginate O-acetyltransferase complex protein AlgI